MQIKNWKIKEKKELTEEIIKTAGSEFLAQLLVQRGIDSQKKIIEFLDPSKMTISSPYVFTDMEKSVKRIFEAIEKQEKIIIYGDFDADGVTSTALLYKTLKFLNAEVEYYIPNRENENHGLNTKALVKLIAKHKTKLLITVDCGISDIEQVNFANGFKVDVIITDHHEAPEQLPQAFAIINPKALNALDKSLSLEEIEALNQLAGVGVAFKLACALLEKKQAFDYVNELIPLVTVGTIADVVPILYENRAFVDMGLKLIAQNKHYGISKLLELSGYKTENNLTSENIAFGVAPRINAAGRLSTVDSALKLLISENKSEINICAEELNNFNKIRQDLCDRIFEEATIAIQNEPSQDSIILYNPEWHLGIIGIVASKLVEKFYKPVFLMTKDKNTGFIRCSSRSIPEIHIRNIISENETLFEYYGGHSQAAGLVFDPQKTSFETVKSCLNESIKNSLNGTTLKPSVFIDLEIDSENITLDLIDEIKQLEPFGEGNKTPLFMTKNLTLNSSKTMDTNNNHIKIFCANNNGKPFECVFWNHEKTGIPQGKPFDAVFYPKLNVFNGITTIQLDLQDLKSEFIQQEQKSETKIYDHRKKTNIFNQINDYLMNTKVQTLVFATKKDINTSLEPYQEIHKRIFSRKEISKCTQIMFFDYPPNEIILNELIQKTGAKTFHFMNYNNTKIDAQELIKNISGMLKYVDSNKNGKVNLCDISDFLSISDETTELCLDLFESLNMIEIIEKNKTNYKIKFLQALEFSKIKDFDMYEELQQELQKIYAYRENLCKMPLEEII